MTCKLSFVCGRHRASGLDGVEETMLALACKDHMSRLSIDSDLSHFGDIKYYVLLLYLNGWSSLVMINYKLS